MRKKLSLTRIAVAVLSVGGFTASNFMSPKSDMDRMILENLEAISEPEASSSSCCERSTGKCWYQIKNSGNEILGYGELSGHAIKC